MIMTREFSFISKHHNCVTGEPGNNGNDIFLFGIQCSDSIGWRERKKKKERVENLVGWLFRRRTRFLRRRELPLKRQITHLVVQGSST